MKTIDQLTNVEKGKIIFDLFRDEIPPLLDYFAHMAGKVASDKEELIENWNNPFINYQQWLSLAEQVSAGIKRYGKDLTKSGNVFSEQLFGGYPAIFSNHCVEQYGLRCSKSERFRQAVALFYQPLQTELASQNQYLVLEAHGGLVYAAICTDADGNNLVFDDRKTAEKEAANCQAGFVVAI